MAQPLDDHSLMRLALRLARRAYGQTSPNPMVGAVLVKDGAIIGQGWHHRAGLPHAEVEAIADARRRQHDPTGATLFVTLEPCCTHGRTPPCTQAILSAGIKKVIVAATDPNPAHAGRGLALLREQGVTVEAGLLAEDETRLNEIFNHWIVHRTPFVTVKAAMSLDGRIATSTGQSKWITGEKARAYGMRLRLGSDAILVGVNTAVADDPSLTLRRRGVKKALRRIVLDPTARIPLNLKVVSDPQASNTTVVVTSAAPADRVAALKSRVQVLESPGQNGAIDLPWLLATLGRENVSSLLVEGGGETNARFLQGRLAQRIVFFYAPLVIGGDAAPRAVGGEGVPGLDEKIGLRDVVWHKLGLDLLLSARVGAKCSHPGKDK